MDDYRDVEIGLRHNVLVYDIEIIKATPPRKKDGLPVPGIEYCAGFEDHANMGVACICAYDAQTDRWRTFTEGNFMEFQELANERLVVGFNSMAFDDKVCAYAGLHVTTGWDLLQEIWVAAGLEREFKFPTHTGRGLDAMAVANGLTGKTGYGGMAGVWWQQGQYGKVIDYCLEDVRLTVELIRKAGNNGSLLDDPKRELYT